MRIALAVTGTIPSRGYGGTQRQVDWLASELARLGHRVVLIVDPDSSHPLCEVRHASSEAQCRAAIPADADIVHFHSWFLDVPFPTLNTAHGFSPEKPRPQPNWSFVSASHARNHGRKTFVYNGFPTDTYRLAGSKNDRLLFLAGISRASKNLNRAVDLAKKFDFPLDIAGGSRWRLLLRSQVRRDGVFFKSLGSRFRFHGVVDGDEKQRLLGAAKAFLNPIAWEEPFGMAPVEAMLCGTPVLTTRRGAMPEIVDDDTGRFFDSDEEFAAALDAIAGLSPQRCRDSAVDRFPISRTAKGYLDLYARILDGETLP
ncbi:MULTISPECIES: glycosyltransferase [unclassified Mesorhizobium]|uniref:glycosyltransferase n=1 Tax=unclassified Mesorhizobium TaxID=325217 RepID=UPI000FD2D5CE|nr:MULTISPECIES: glycosyltransferase [unclassified Mesorhizobium]RUU95051.1 glycosyltransferase family 4 protein [Mesorhizobium sp. M6A.T.Cr.TU.017.01.1.1]RVB72104.1 glycosyltransferase family 4 protein [Mesorhizobium sp. M6A.T.Cr.TU.014.01.1.1]RWO97393.1 MAG: glycosyltransferase family 4 protein [Mesorhizobium sp.]RWP42531.1 MAG: glycosyltransferase family 4 protein [Mesorhizobium sp.]RWP71423.1 MAG: glycosyltransferase family 4 protein [Mesorhizobium sp.]